MEKTPMRKNKKCRFFEIYISKLLKTTYSDNSLNSNAKTQISNALTILTRIIAISSLKLLCYNNKKVLSIKEVSLALKKQVDEKVFKMCKTVGTQAITNYNIYTEKKSVSRKPRKNKRAMLTIPPSIVEKIIRSVSPKYVMIGSQTPIFLTACIEYILGELLDVSVQITIQDKKQRITIDHLEKAIQMEPSLNYIFKKANFIFLGGKGEVDIHRDILKNSTESKKEKCTIKNIEKRQKNNKLIVPKTVFERLVRKIIKKKCGDRKVSGIVFLLLQYYIENYIVNILKKANILTLYNKRNKVTPTDIGMVAFLQNGNRDNFLLRDYYLHMEKYTITDIKQDFEETVEYIDEGIHSEPEQEIDTEFTETEFTEAESEYYPEDGTVIEVGNTEVEETS